MTPEPPSSSHYHHYVPQWYQRGFVTSPDKKYLSLDKTIAAVKPDGKPYRIRPKSPKSCFVEKDLNTLQLGKASSDKIETEFFGIIDDRGSTHVPKYANYKGWTKGLGDAFNWTVEFMGAQYLRTPRGLNMLRRIGKRLDLKDPNAHLYLMIKFHQQYTTMWYEGVWEIVHAHNSNTKFIVSDNPITLYNAKTPPTQQADFSAVGTRTIYPLSLESCLIVTHSQFAKNPRYEALAQRSNARSHEQVLRHFDDMQFGRELEEFEVLKINHILKSRAERYIAANREEFLYPERYVNTAWDKLDDDWFLLPHLWKIPMHVEIMAGGNGVVYRADAYGRTPGNPDFKREEQHDYERRFHDMSEKAWAMKRVGKSRAQVMDTMRLDTYTDKHVDEYLANQSDDDKARLASYLQAVFPVPVDSYPYIKIPLDLEQDANK